MQQKGQSGGNPQQTAVRMLKKIYKEFTPAEKNMSEDQFIRESLGHLREAKKNKSSIVRPN